MNGDSCVQNQPVPSRVLKVIVFLRRRNSSIILYSLFLFLKIILNDIILSPICESLYPISYQLIQILLFECDRESHFYVISPVLIELVDSDASI